MAATRRRRQFARNRRPLNQGDALSLKVRSVPDAGLPLVPIFMDHGSRVSGAALLAVPHLRCTSDALHRARDAPQ
jgi:hypothetical protein